MLTILAVLALSLGPARPVSTPDPAPAALTGYVDVASNGGVLGDDLAFTRTSRLSLLPDPSLVALGDGFLMYWPVQATTLGFAGVDAQRFDAHGKAMSGAFELSALGNFNSFPSMAAASDGEDVVFAADDYTKLVVARIHPDGSVTDVKTFEGQEYVGDARRRDRARRRLRRARAREHRHVRVSLHARRHARRPRVVAGARRAQHVRRRGRIGRGDSARRRSCSTARATSSPRAMGAARSSACSSAARATRARLS